MLENAKVTIDLQDLDQLRKESKELREIKYLLSIASTPEIDTKGSVLQKVTLRANLGILGGLLWKYVDYENKDRQWIAELDESDIGFSFKDKV